MREIARGLTAEGIGVLRLDFTGLGEKSFVSLDDADHLLTRHRDACYTGAVLATWAGRYIDLLEPEAEERG